jgi:hypothetical protein
MPAYDPSLPIRHARTQYFAESGFSSDGGYGDEWVKLKIGRFAFGFPNTSSRVRAVKLHDIHHVLTEYATTWVGESEIGAWEIASGCGRHYPAWFLNFGAFAIGLALAPRRVFKAFVRGRHSHNLYAGEFQDHMLDRTVGELRTELTIPAQVTSASPRDLLAFAVWSSVSTIVSVLPYLIAITAAVMVLRLTVSG